MDVNLLSHAHVQLGISYPGDFYATGEVSTLEILKRVHGTEISNIIDVGANDGTYSEFLADIFPNAQIYALEPMADMYLKSKSLLADKRNTEVVNIGLHKEEGTISLYNSLDEHNNQISTSYKEGLVDFYHVQQLKEYKIEVDTLDRFCENRNISILDFLKIDVEGGELDVLNGAKSLLENAGIKIIQFEFNDFNTSSRTFLKDFYQMLSGYNFYRISRKGLKYLGNYSTAYEIFIYQNILAIHKSVDKFNKDVRF